MAFWLILSVEIGFGVEILARTRYNIKRNCENTITENTTLHIMRIEKWENILEQMASVEKRIKF